MKTLISLIGEQPIPVLLPILHLKPESNIFLYSETVEKTKDQLVGIIPNAEGCKIDPYDIVRIDKQIAQSTEWGNEICFNITGGTKSMSLAVYRLAARRKVEMVYLESEYGISKLHRYGWFDGGDLSIEKEIIGELLTIDLYLKAHGFNYTLDKKSEPFENAVCDALSGDVFELLRNVRRGSLEIDLVVRCGNQVGIAEIKHGKEAERKHGIDELSTATQREYLGTYNKRFLITDRSPRSKNLELALAHKISVIILEGDYSSGLSEGNRTKLTDIVSKELGRPASNPKSMNEGK